MDLRAKNRFGNSSWYVDKETTVNFALAETNRFQCLWPIEKSSKFKTAMHMGLSHETLDIASIFYSSDVLKESSVFVFRVDVFPALR